MHYAIDFGTSNTAVARIDDRGVIENVSLKDISQFHANNPPLIPSLVFVEDATSARVTIGQLVRDRGLDFSLGFKGNHQQRFFQNFKRAIAQPLSGFVPELDDIPVNAAMIGEWFLAEIIKQLPDITSLVITVPVDSFESYRSWLAEVCMQLAVKEVRILDEPTAAALGYGLTAGRETVLVVDMGGGTLDMSLVGLNFKNNGDTRKLGFLSNYLLKWGDRADNQFLKSQPKSQPKSPIAKVIAKTGQNLGGIDIDNWLMAYFHNQGCPKNTLTMRLAEKLKIALSTSERATEVFFDDETFITYNLELQRSQFQDILQQQNFFTQLDTALAQIVRQARRQDLELENIDAVLLVGGTAQIPAVQTWIGQYFPAAKIKSSKPFTAIAHGALDQRFQLQDFLYHSYGVRYWDKRYRQHNWHPIIKAGITYPTAPVELVLGASQVDQPSIELVIGELGETDIEVYFEGESLITRNLKPAQIVAQPLGAEVIAHLDPLGQPGSDRLKILFKVDAYRTLHISIEDLLTKKLILQNLPVLKLI